jgi:eukaryotic-like serine/threonine-protein kinase
MDAVERQRRAAGIVAELLGADPAQRESRLARLAADPSGGEELVALVRRMLAAESVPTLAPDAVASRTRPAPSIAPHPDADRSPARRLGAYTIEALLGEGGMGAVYLARQDRPRRTVALKVIRPGLVTERMLRRFELESEILAQLQHPGIAQIYEAGTAPTPDGPQPFFAMELVRGSPLTIFARAEELDLRQKLRLFIKVCDAVQHAHQKGVIHRDLKPSNILVAVPDVAEGAPKPPPEAAQPKILDFGIARRLDDAAGDPTKLERTFQTEAGALVGTIPYMSPEQIAGESAAAIDTRSDVYTLGVILYELLAGKLPHAVGDKTIPEAARIITMHEPTPLSAVDRSLRGEVQTIVAKAMEKDRSRRYQSAGDLAADVRRFLSNEPILARPPSRAYLFRKFAARNRAMVVASSIAALALTGGATVATVQAVRAEAARRQAQADAAFAKASNNFLTEMLAAANPDRNNEREVTVREMIDRAAKKLAQESSAERPPGASRTDPRVAMSLHNTLSSTYRTLGSPKLAVEQAEHAVKLAETLEGPWGEDTIDAKRTLAMALGESARFDEALELARACVAKLSELHGPHHLEFARARAELGRLLLEMGRLQEAESELSPALERLVALLGERHDDTVSAIDHTGMVLQRLGRFEDAERFARRALAIREALYGKDSVVTAYSLNNLANIAQKMGRNEEAAALLRRALDNRTAHLDPDHPSVLVAMSNLAVALTGLGKPEQAEPLLREAWTRQAEKLGPTHPKAMTALGNLGFVLEDQDKLDEAEEVLRRVVDLRRSVGLNAQEAWGDMNNLAMLLQRRGKPDEAERLYLELLPLCEQNLPPEHYVTAIFRSNYGDCLTDLARFADARRELDASQKVLDAFFKPEHARAQKGRARLERLAAAEQAATPARTTPPPTTPGR